MRSRLAVLLAATGIVVLGGFVLLKGATSTVAEHVGDPGVSVECSGWTGVGSGCAAWGEQILAGGAPSNTF
jgi:hypothetical protein